MLISMTEALQRQRGCVVAFNFYNLESLSAVLKVAKRRGRIVAAALGERYLDHLSIPVAYAMAQSLSRELELDFVLHLDHAGDIRHIKQAIQDGFTSVMYDGSSLPLEENIRNTLTVVRLAHSKGVSVEGELGYLNDELGEEPAVHSGLGGFTQPQDAMRFCRETEVDLLAIAAGNAHGIYSKSPQLDFSRINDIAKSCKAPLVLHGCSGIPYLDLRQVIKLGIRKININTELAVGAAQAAQRLLIEQNHVRFEKVVATAQQAMEQIADQVLSQLE